MKKLIAVLMCGAMLTAALCGCGGPANYKDGTYTGKSEVYEGDEDGNGNGYGEVVITIKDNVITECEFKTYEPDGTLKDENYGKANGEIKNQDFYNKAQKAVAGSAEYGKKLVEAGSLDGVDSISGATISYNEFLDAVSDALDKAKE